MPERTRRLVRCGIVCTPRAGGLDLCPPRDACDWLRQAEASLDVDLPDNDQPILLAAIAAGATHLLTGDRAHFGPYFGRRIAGVLVARPGDYLASRA